MLDPETAAEEILDKLGVSEPKDLDVNAIAYYCGATIVYERLTGCEATIAGYGDRAIITVNSEAHPGRKRFSAGINWVRMEIEVRAPLGVPGDNQCGVDQQPPDSPISREATSIAERLFVRGEKSRSTYTSHDLA